MHADDLENWCDELIRNAWATVVDDAITKTLAARGEPDEVSVFAAVRVMPEDDALAFARLCMADGPCAMR